MRTIAEVLAAVDEVNAADPNVVEFAGASGPKEVIHSDRMTWWLDRLTDSPTDAQRIAARAHHLRRWASPRDEYPDGRAGYLRWRVAAKNRHVAEVATLLAANGCDTALIADVSRIMAKEGRTTHADVQAHEDALCLTFCELQLDDLIDRLGREHSVEVVRKTIAKMSPAGIALVADVEMSDVAQSVIAEATVSPA